MSVRYLGETFENCVLLGRLSSQSQVLLPTGRIVWVINYAISTTGTWTPATGGT